MRFYLLPFLLLLLSCASGGDDEQDDRKPIASNIPVVTLHSQNAGSVAVGVELARTPAEQAKGLKFRDSLEQFAGMLFIFNFEAVRGFTMEDTLIPLDIVFIDSTKRVVGIAKSTVPNTPGPYSTNTPFLYALELNAGFTDNFDVKVGDRVSFSGFDF